MFDARFLRRYAVADAPTRTVRSWADGSWAIDRNIPLLVVNHATAEEWGMRSLAVYLRRQFPDVPVRHLSQGCLYQTVGAT